MNKAEFNLEFERIFKEGCIAQLSKLRVKRQWNKITSGKYAVSMPKIACFLFKYEYVVQLGDLIKSRYSPELMKAFKEHQAKEYNLTQGVSLGQPQGFCHLVVNKKGTIDHYDLIVSVSTKNHRTLDDIIFHEICHVAEHEIKMLQKQGNIKIVRNGEFINPKEEILIHKQIELVNL